MASLVLHAADLSLPSQQMANNLEGGKTPQLPPAELQRLGFKLVAYPLSLLGVSLQAMRMALAGIANGHAPAASALPSFQVSLPPPADASSTSLCAGPS